MNKLLYISDYPLNTKSGHGNMIDMHHAILKELFGNEMIECYGNSQYENTSGNVYRFRESDKLNKFLAVISGNPPYLNYRFEKQVMELVKNISFKYVIIENSVSGNLLRKIKNIDKQIFIVSYFPDIEQDLMQKQAEKARLYRRISLNTMIKNEKVTAKVIDSEIVLNSRDSQLFERYYGRKPKNIIPIIVPISKKENLAVHHAHNTLELLFVGVDYYPNVYGVEWFIEKVCPLITVPYVLKIVGFHMERYKKRWEAINKKIEVIGTVDQIEPYYMNADAVIAPIFEGGGMKVKTAEALAYGKIVVGTEESTFGYWENAGSLRNTGIFNCKDEYEFAEKINQLIEKEYCKKQNEICAWMEREFSINSNIKRFKQALLMEVSGDNND